METDLIWMTLLVFVPSVFALGLLFFPKGREDAMCWFALVGTAVTLGVSIAVFIGFKQNVVDRENVTNTREERARLSLDHRVAVRDAAEGDPSEYSGSDWVARYPWIGRFNIDYYLGIDGISMALILLTTFLSFLSMIASFHIKRYDGG